MKKLMVIQSKGRSFGGVWFVNKAITEGLLEKGFTIKIVSVRENKTTYEAKCDSRIDMYTINVNDLWEKIRKIEILNEIVKFNIRRSIIMFFERKKQMNKLKDDYRSLQRDIIDFDPDYIIVSHYELLESIPMKYLSRAINHFHSSFEKANKDVVKVFNKYKNKIGKFLWLTESTCLAAKNRGFENSEYIYNPVRIESSELAKVSENKKLVTIARLSSLPKRIYLMVKIVNDIFNDGNFSDWKLELYGLENVDKETEQIISGSSQIEVKGPTYDVKGTLLGSSIYLSTSSFEGFPMSILEANECGVPVVSLSFGESTNEVVRDGITGFVIENDDIFEFSLKLKELMSDGLLISKMGEAANGYVNKFHIENIISDWLSLFSEIDDNRGGVND